MSTQQKQAAWLERVEAIIHVLEGSSIGELELSEAGLELIIRRSPGMVLVNAPQITAMTAISSDGSRADVSQNAPKAGVAILAPLTGVYYSAASPSSPPFANIGDIIQVGQVVALVEAMKVFNEIQSEVAGRVIELPAQSGSVVQKGEVLLRIEAL